MFQRECWLPFIAFTLITKKLMINNIKEKLKIIHCSLIAQKRFRFYSSNDSKDEI